MRHVAATALILTLSASPGFAQDGDNDVRDGLDMLSEGARTLMEGLLDDMRPMLEEAQPFFEDEVAPFFANLWALIDDVTSYEMPERLPNGDIIIRRSPDAPPVTEDETHGDGVEL
jgi:hypothetical protein